MRVGRNPKSLRSRDQPIGEIGRERPSHEQLVAGGVVDLQDERLGARDEGPGIRDVAQAMQYGYSTRKGLGVGLPGAKWLMDEFDIASEVGRGTTITMKKWKR